MSVNGQEVAGSPFPMLVSIHPTQLGKPVRVITTGRLCPRDVAVSSSGEVVVAFQKNIVVYDKNGKKLRSCKAHDFNLPGFWSVTVDNSSNSIFLLGNSHKIIQLNLDLKVMKEISIGGSIYYTGLTLVGDELMMCNSIGKVVSWSITKIWSM